MKPLVPKLVAHRGYASRYPENTLPALGAAVEAGARYLEFDLQLSGDGSPVLLHDVDFLRTGGRTEQIWDLHVSDLVRFPVGMPDRFGAEFGDVCAPTLADVVAWWRRIPDVRAFVELKEESLQHFGIEPMLEAVLRELEPVRHAAMLISYDIRLVAAARQHCRMPVGWVVPEWDDPSRRIAAEHGPDYLFCNWKRFPADGRPLWKGPWRWASYEVADAAHAIALATRGVEFVETMAIGDLLRHPLFHAGGSPKIP